MKKIIFLSVMATCLLLSGCGKKREESVPLVADEDMQIEETEESREEITMPELDSRLGSLEFSVNDEEYALPVSIAELVEKGWSYDGDSSEEVQAESFLEERTLSLGALNCQADITNFSAEALPVEECFVGRIVLDTKSDEQAQIGLPGGIIIGQSTVVQAKKAYGEASDRYDDGALIVMTYEFGVYKKAVLTFEAGSEVLIQAELRNQTNPDEEKELGKLDRAATDEVAAYQSPLMLTDDLMDFTVEYAGSYYSLPAPVRAFMDNGWKIDKESSDTGVKSGKYGYVTLLNEGRKLYVLVYNYGGETAAIENCFVTTVYGDLTTTKVPIRIAHDITLGMNRDDFLSVIEGLGGEKTEDKENRTEIYTFYLNEEKQDYTEVTVDLDLQMVSGISLVHDRETDEQTQQEIIQAQQETGDEQGGI